MRQSSTHRQHGDGQSDSCAMGQQSFGRCCSGYGPDDERCPATLPGIELHQPSTCGEEPSDCDSKLQGCFDTASTLQEAHQIHAGIVKDTLLLHGEWVNWATQAAHVIPLIERIIDQAERRVIKGESVSMEEKVVSLFEPHTDIIVKDKRQVQYGHKINFSSGKHGMILDAVIESGNPADSSRLLPLIMRLDEVYGKLPNQVAADVGYASTANIDAAKELGIKAVGLPKKVA